MSTDELAATIGRMTAAERLALGRCATRIIAMRKAKPSMKVHTKEELIRRVGSSRAEQVNGALVPASVILAKIRERYAISD